MQLLTVTILHRIDTISVMEILFSLKAVETGMEEAAAKLEEATEAVMEDLELQTGSTPSSTGDDGDVDVDVDGDGDGDEEEEEGGDDFILRA